MATVFLHAMVPVAARVGLGREIVPGRLLLAGMVATFAPDLDVLAFKLGIPYGDPFGHRGFTHSLVFAAFLGLLAAMFHRRLGAGPVWSFAFVTICAASHGFLDAFTNGGLGVAFLWPFSDSRFFMPWTPVEVSPIGVRNFLTDRGMAVLRSEGLTLLPVLGGLALVLAFLRRRVVARLLKRPPWE